MEKVDHVSADPATGPLPRLETAGPRVTARSIFLGAVTAAALCVWTNYTEFVMHSAALVMSNLPMSALIPFVFWLFLNVILKRFVPRLSLTGTELLVILGMGWMVGTVPAIGWTGYWAGIMTAPEYYASPENGWRDAFFDVLPPHLFPAPTVVSWFYNGLPPNVGLPWSGWLAPLFWWGSVALAVVGMGICTVVLFQKQWTDNERLTFPLATIPIKLTKDFDVAGARVPAWFRNPLFWAGFAIPAFVIGWNIARYFNETIPHIDIFDGYWAKQVVFFRQFPPYSFRILPSLIAFTYFCNLDILLSFWLFSFLAIFKIGIMNRLGITVGVAGQPAKAPAILGLESHGALIALAVWSIWISRGHLKQVWQSVVSGDDGDHNPLMPYRTAVGGLIFCMCIIIGWLTTAGQGILLATVSAVLMFLAYFCSTKFLAASGFAYLYPPDINGGGFVKTMFGTTGMTRTQLTGIQLHNSGAFVGGGRIMGMTMIPHYFRMLGDRPGRRWIVPSLWIAFLAGAGASFAYVLDLCYTQAGLNLRTYTLTSGNTSTFNSLMTTITGANRTVFDPQKLAVWLFGAGEVILLSAMRSWLSWWPLHPVGLVFQHTIGVRVFGFSAFLTWMIKLIVLKLGGIGLYRKTQPLFLGLLIGYAAMIGISSVIDAMWFPGEGHWVHGW